jgi:hypothetical protein
MKEKTPITIKLIILMMLPRLPVNRMVNRLIRVRLKKIMIWKIPLKLLWRRKIKKNQTKKFHRMKVKILKMIRNS